MKIVLLTVGFFLGGKIVAQTSVPLIRANSPKISIKDGVEGKTRYWNHLIKSKTSIVYHLAMNAVDRQVVFYTDVDSIRLSVKSNADYPFAVLLNSKDTCSVVLTTKTDRYDRIDGIKSTPDSVPFILNKNRQIIIKGSINNSPPIDFSVDLGARMICVIGKDLDRSNKLIVDGLLEDESVTGLATEKTSSKNKLEFGNLSFSDIAVCYIDEEGFLEKGGGLIGFNVFQNKVLEIDFDNQLLLIHDQLPDKIESYSQIDFKQTTGGLYVPIVVNNGQKEVTGWFFFDTGADYALALDAKFTKKENLKASMKVVGKVGIASSESGVLNADLVEVPQLQFGGFNIKQVPALMANESNSEAEFEDGVVGIGLQSRFNIIIDFPHSKLYLKPSRYFEDSFKKKGTKANLLIWISSILILSFVGLVIYRRMVFQK